MNRTPRHILLMALLLLMGSTAWAQNDPQFVIKRRTDAGATGTHYLSHVKNGNKWELQDATVFSPNCLWYSGNTVDQSGLNHNYYFIETIAEETVYHFLSAPLEAGGQIKVSDSLPSAQLLRNKEQNYYFYDWDWDTYGGGVARGYKHTGISQTDCQNHVNPTYSWGSGECWEVYWVEYNNVSWKLADASHYTLNNPAEPVPYAARFRPVSVTPHALEVTNVTTGQLADLDDFTLEAINATKSLSVTAGIYSYSYIPAYTTYVFEGETHNYFNNADQGENTPTETNGTGTPTSYQWTITGPGARYLSFHATDSVTVASGASQTLHYYRLNETGHKTATLTLTVTYSNGITQVRTAMVTVKTPCGNPLAIGDPVVVYDFVTVSWVNTAEKYRVEWKKQNTTVWDPANSVEDLTSNTYTFSGLDDNTAYHYRVSAYCGEGYLEPPTTWGEFTTKKHADLLINGAVYGGGRVADVTGHTEVIIINCDSIGAVYGGNDIAGSVLDTAAIILGVNASNANDSYAHLYNGDQGSTKVRVNDVYGGGNGYYAYNGSSFTPASSSYKSQEVAPGGHVLAMTQTNQLGEEVWTNDSESPITLNFPSIVKTHITVTNDQVKVDSIFGGAKNAFVTHIIGINPENDKPIYATNGSTVNVDGGTVLAVYGGNNIGGGQGYGKHRINVSHTTTNLAGSLANTATTGFGRDFGIRYLFGGGNKVAGSTTDVFITGGQLDTIFGGGNEADVYAANVTVNCSLGAYNSEKPYTYGNTYTKAINPGEYTTGIIGKTTIDTVNYPWDGFTGIYNIRTLFGGNNQANMNSVPNISLSSGSVGTVYGGGNAGDMLSYSTGDCTEQYQDVKYSTHVLMNSPTMLVDYLYGGCQVSNVDYGTWVEIKNGHVGNVYGGCNVSGDVGSTRVNQDLEPINLDDPLITPEQKREYFLKYQEVQGATYVVTTGGVVYKTLFAGGNGYYHCNDGICYSSDPVVHYGDPEGHYIGLRIPTHNETHVIVSEGSTVRGNVYAGGNMAPVGFNGGLVGNAEMGYKPFPTYVGYASVCMEGGTVKGDVYGGGNMAAVYGSNEVQVSGGKIEGALYGGNDKLGMVAQMTNRALPEEYFLASDGNTPLTEVDTYIGLTGHPDINIVYGGGNGDYDYEAGEYCNPEDNMPIQSNIFVDINIDGYPADGGGHINTVYGGGNGVTVTGQTTVFLNIAGEGGGEPLAYDHVGTIFGGNNKGHLDILSDIILLKGQVNTVYGGCNQGAMIGDKTVTGADGTEYEHVGSVVRLRDEYTVHNTVDDITVTTIPTAKVSGAVYGGCRMNGVNHNSLVLVEGGNHSTATIFGGSDISGDVGDTSRVVITNGTHGTNATVLGDVFGAGNGNYDYTSGDYAGLRKPYSVHSLVEMKSGTAANLYAGGYAGPCGVTSMQLEDGTVTGKVFGGGNMAGTVTSNNLTTTTVDELGNVTIETNTSTTSGTSTVTMNNGTVRTGIYGGCNNSGDIAGKVLVNINGGTVGAIDHLAKIHGGGYGQGTTTSGNVELNIGVADAASRDDIPLIYGDIYGGSGFGNVNASATDTTMINFLNGTLKGKGDNIVYGAIYGGGLGQKAVEDDLGTPDEDESQPAIEAKVFGKVYVNISNNDQAPGRCFIDLREANVFGCNNANGSPQDSVTVNIYKTAYNFSDYPTGDKYTSTYDAPEEETPCYAIRQVFGGGNEANYAPENGSTSSTRLTTVNVFDCNNTIGRTFGGGNAAAAYKVASNIYGGRFHQVFGGGNGTADISANIGEGGATLNVYNGNILQLFGGNNLNGEITGPMAVNVTNDGNCNENIVEFFGGSNKAVMGSINPVNLVTTINCSADPVSINTVYGGSNLASIRGNVTVNIKGGEFKNVFGGSKGETGTEGAANIDGTVTLNLFGGSVQQAFGGSNVNGNITGLITVNVLDTVNHCGLQLDTVYGSGNLTIYQPNSEIVSPQVNILKGTVRKVVYGGGKGTTAVVTANPKVTIGDNTHSAYVTKIYGPVFGGGNAAPVSGNTTVICQANHNTDTIYNLFGGGNEAGVSGNTTVSMYSGKITQGIYGGCNTHGTVTGDINVKIYGGTLGINGTPMTAGIFGGGQGNDTHTSGDVTVTIDKASEEAVVPTIYANVYGGSALGQVGAAGKTAMVDLKNGTVNGMVFGGGEGNNTYTAEVSGNAQLAIAGNVTKGVYGGCNLKGVVVGDAIVGITGGTIGAAEPENRANVYGGGLGENTVVNGNVAVTVNSASGNIYGDVYGGSAKGVVNCTWDTDHYVQTANDTTGVTFMAGTIHGDLYGGGHGLESHAADVYGDVTVKVHGGTANNVFGCNNLLGQPKEQVKVIINETTPSAMSIDSVFGGGNQAYYEGTPKVEIREGTVNYKVFGGGNNIADENKGVAGSDVLMVGGTVLGGIYGGCNTNGDVTGDVLVRLTGGTIGADDARANIHGGGYGRLTMVQGNVTVTFGDLNTTNPVYPMLYGDLYGGSALGSVNDASSDQTTVNIYSGTITGVGEGTENYGNVFGGGLGSSAVAAMVNGKVHVNIGSETGGKATLINCNVFGCNNVKGSPQDDVYVDVYQTAHTPQNEAGYFDTDRDYAIYQLFGGGNRAHYAPENGNVNSQKKTHVTIHDCDNTVNYVYGGGNAADAVGVVTIIQGGRFNEIYGGGNGQETAANIGEGGMGLNVLAGNVSFLFRGSNKNGEIAGEDYVPPATTTCSGGLFVDSYFFGTNEAELYYDLNNIIQCADAGSFEYRYVYAGSRWGIVYGDISLTVCGGTIENLFGGCRGYERYSADVRRFPTFEEITADLELPEENRKYSQALRDHMGYDPENPSAGEPSYAGHGGNINLVINGGTIGKVFGGCDIKGNVEGKITVTINEDNNESCPLFVGEVYGASNRWDYEPNETDVNSPVVQILKGTIGGSHTDLPVNNISGTAPTEYEGNVFGGGNFGDIASNPIVIIGDGPTAKVTVKGNVFGGGNEGDVDGSPKVTIVPVAHTLTIADPSFGNYVRVTTSSGETVTSGASIGEGMSLELVAIPSSAGYVFSNWTVTGVGASVANPTASSTSFTMGTGDCSITAVFNTATPYQLTFGVDPATPAAGGTLVVKDAQGNTVSSGNSIGQGSVLTLVASPNLTYKFKKWTINGVDNTNPAATTYTMGASATNIIAVFEAATTHVLTFDATPGHHGTVEVTDNHDQTVTSGASVGEGAVLSVKATPASNYSFSGWTVTGNGAFANVLASETSFTMENGDATIAASFVPNHPFIITASEHGTVKVTDALGHTVASGTRIGEGAKLNLKATPAPGYAFKQGRVTGPESSTVENPNAPVTSFTMGTDETTIGAEFVAAHVLTITSSENGTVKVTNVLNQTVTSPASIGVGAQLTLKATPADGHTFNKWEVTSGDGTITETTKPTTTFTMGSGDTTIRAIFN